MKHAKIKRSSPRISVITTIDLSGDAERLKNFSSQKIPKDFSFQKYQTRSGKNGLEYNENGQLQIGLSKKMKERIFVLPFIDIALTNETEFHTSIKEDKQVFKQAIDIEQESAQEIEDIFAPPKHREMFGLFIPKHSYTFLVEFSLVAFFIVLPIFGAMYYHNLKDVKTNIMKNSRDALAYLDNGKISISQLNFNAAQENFKQAHDGFMRARKEYEGLNFFLKNMLLALPKERKSLKAGNNLIAAGEDLANIGKNISQSLEALLGGRDFAQKLSVLQSSISFALPKIALAEKSLSELDLNDFSPANQEALKKAQIHFPIVKESLIDSSSLIQPVVELLGYGQWKRYLVAFQNNNELRATGGFFGSFALIDIEEGKIKNIEIPAGGTYDLQGSLRLLSASPAFMHLINPRLEFQDANIWPDFRVSAQKMSDMLHYANGPSVDGVMAVNVSLIEKILEVTGPIELPQYGRVLGMSNFSEQVQNIVHVENEKAENKPKQILADFTPKLLDRIGELETHDTWKLLQTVYQGLEEKDLQLYSFDSRIQDLIETLNWGGAMMETKADMDYVSVVNTNVGGEKSDKKIQQDIQHVVRLENDHIVSTLTLTRIHSGVKGEALSGVQNNSYIRVYVRAGTRLLDARGFETMDPSFFSHTLEGLQEDSDISLREGQHFFDAPTGVEIYKEADKTVFAGWLLVRPGEQKSVSLTYVWPTDKRQSKIYTLAVQKQSGVSDTLYHLIIPIDTFSVKNTYPATGMVKDGTLIFEEVLDTDKFFAIEYE